ncbi:MAG: response regulator [Sphingomonadales bacterium]|nr:MAG: response regulator [Sphingomonadales bacterium]
MTNMPPAVAPARPLLLLVEDDDGVRRGLQLLLQGQGFDVHAFASARAALANTELHAARYLVADYALADSDGIELLTALRAKGWRGTGILITAFASPDLRAAALSAGFSAMLDKPFRDDDLLRALRGCEMARS